ncbi:sulfurtransferase [Neolewinella antarctica]|uniref:Thiosulfate/3-mercaptopyruvate sulfurtransferase n=1 Tax=Neolewinella antarctica TaxID=442734 RepID=A0ABX0X9P0_9BACT|nr:sulfurtransferase [Neolewinella antarctica]NJC25669.1 thiosulfate/3-mercaptopyruvate sulfurtransferase [Neolewinella antarctica]
MPLITPTTLANLTNNPATLIFDCRHDLFHPEAGLAAYREGHIPGAHHLHLDEDLSGEIIPGKTGRHPLPESQLFANLMSTYGLSKGKTVVAYDDKGGGIAARLWWMLRAIGHEDVRVLDGGWPAWTAAGLPTETGDLPLPETDYRRVTEPYSAPTYQLRTRVRAQIITLNSSQLLVDSRTADRYRGDHEPIDPVAGSIDGAVNYPWPENLTANGSFKSAEELRTRFAALNDQEDITFYCGSGVTACHNLLAFYLAYDRMEGLYPGGWSEWITEV